MVVAQSKRRARRLRKRRASGFPCALPAGHARPWARAHAAPRVAPARPVC